MAGANFIRITTIGDFLSQLVINVWHYRRDSGTALIDMPALAADFDAVVLTPVSAIISAAMHWPTIRITELDGDLVEYDNTSIAEHGGVGAGTDLPPFAAWSFLMKRTTNQTFNGHKRFAGVPESLQDNGVATATALALMPAAQAGLLASITDGTSVFTPCIYSTILNGSLRTTPLANPVSAVLYKGITTQNSRKYGRGA